MMEKKFDQNNQYALLDSGNGRKLERFGPYVLSRPCSQAVWLPQLSQSEWQKADAIFMRESDVKWTFRNKNIPESWQIEVAGVQFKISPTDFGHLGIFPEQQNFWQWIQSTIHEAKTKRSEPLNILNLFAYSGGSTLASAKAGAHVCHLDASKGMVTWARENAVINKLEAAPIRWIIEDVGKFLQREGRRGKRYDGIILDPPSFGRGSKGEVFKIEEHLLDILKQCQLLLTEKPLFILFSCHTPGFTPITLRNLLGQVLQDRSGHIEQGEMLLSGTDSVLSVPSGTYARWIYD